MTKQFAMIVGWVLILVGILNFFLEPIKLMPAHGVFHIVAGLLGVVLSKSHKGYTMWVGVIGVLLAVIGFAGVEEILGIIDLPVLFNYVHALLGVAGLLVYFGARGGGAMAKPAAGQMGQSGMSQ
ncbi:MAG: hypothetical protein HY421_00185 [Candidatus Kerfeldbacteria bacterium]|nr:hypothetical protein [Candidatus Kerfeldbacteria bacterium]